MRVLLIEDDEKFIETLSAELDKVRPPIDPLIAKSKASAISLIESDEYFDLAICDLKIPTQDNALDLDVDHGLAVQASILKRRPGTPVIILSSFAELEMMEELILDAKQLDIFGNNRPISMLQYLPKGKVHICIDRISDYSIEFQALDDIVISLPAKIVLHKKETRLIQNFSRRIGGAMATVQEIHGGLSGSRTFLVDVTDAKDKPRGWSVAKIGKSEKILDERNRFRTIVAPMLSPGRYSPEIAYIEIGMGALFYHRDAKFERSLFDVLRNDPKSAPAYVEHLRETEEKWIESAYTDQYIIEEIRSCFVEDEAIGEELSEHVDWKAFEARSVMCNRSCQHGDLHPGNILADRGHQTLLIDYGKTSDNLPLATDPIFLELSLLFHPESQEIVGAWPDKEAAFHWFDVDRYVMRCPIPEFILSCRNWANEISSNYRESLAIVYSISYKQLEFTGIDKEIIYALIKGVIAAFD